MKFGNAKVTPFVSIESTDSKFVGAPATRDALARRRNADDLIIGGRGYRTDFAGPGTAELYWDALIAQSRLLQLPDLWSGEWVNSGGHYDRQKGVWMNTEGATGIPISILRDVVLGRILELGLTKEAIDKFVTRLGRTVAEEEAFFRIDFTARVEALRTGAAL